MPIVVRAVPRMLAQPAIHKRLLRRLAEQPVMYVRSVKPVHTLLRVQQAVRSVRQVNIPAVPVKVLARLVLRVHIIAARVTPDVQLARRVITARAAAQEPDVRQENTVMQPEVRQKRIVLLVRQVHTRQPEQALARIAQPVHTRMPEQTLVLLVRPERIRMPEQALVQPVRTNRLHGSTAIAAERRNVLRRVTQKPVCGRKVLGVIALRTNAVPDSIVPTPAQVIVQVAEPEHINPALRTLTLLVRHVRTNRLHGSTAIAAERRNVLRRVMQRPVRGRQALGAIALRMNAVQDNTVPIPAQVLAKVVRPIRIKAVRRTTTRLVRIAVAVNGLTQEQVLVRTVQPLMLPAIYGT